MMSKIWKMVLRLILWLCKSWKSSKNPAIPLTSFINKPSERKFTKEKGRKCGWFRAYCEFPQYIINFFRHANVTNKPATNISSIENFNGMTLWSIQLPSFLSFSLWLKVIFLLPWDVVIMNCCKSAASKFDWID